jgi:hypothetical protein
MIYLISASRYESVVPYEGEQQKTSGIVQFKHLRKKSTDCYVNAFSLSIARRAFGCWDYCRYSSVFQ